MYLPNNLRSRKCSPTPKPCLRRVPDRRPPAANRSPGAPENKRPCGIAAGPFLLAQTPRTAPPPLQGLAPLSRARLLNNVLRRAAIVLHVAEGMAVRQGRGNILTAM